MWTTSPHEWRTEKRENNKGGKDGYGGPDNEKRTDAGVNRKMGSKNRCYWRNSEYRLLPKCPLRGAPNRESSSGSALSRNVTLPLDPQFPIGSPAHVQEAGFLSRMDVGNNCGQPLSAKLDPAGKFSSMDANSVVALDTGAKANIVC